MPLCDIHCSENIINTLIKKIRMTLWHRITHLLMINLVHTAPLTCAYRPYKL